MPKKSSKYVFGAAFFEKAANMFLVPLSGRLKIDFFTLKLTFFRFYVRTQKNGQSCTYARAVRCSSLVCAPENRTHRI